MGWRNGRTWVGEGVVIEEVECGEGEVTVQRGRGKWVCVGVGRMSMW